MDSGVLNLLITIPESARIINGHLQYGGSVKLLVSIESVGSAFKKVVLVNPASKELQGNDLCDPSQLILYAIAYCAMCAAFHVPGARRRCDPFAFFLPPTIEDPITVLMSFDDFNTRFSRVLSFKVPYRYPGLFSDRCDNESLMYVPSLIPSSRY